MRRRQVPGGTAAMRATRSRDPATPPTCARPGRRAALHLFAAAATAALAGPVRAADGVRAYRIGYLSTPTRESVASALDAFLRKLRELGYVEGRNLVIEYRWAEGDVDRLPALAADLVRSKVDLIVAPAGSAALAARDVTATIPIVTIFPANPVELGLVASLSHPGGNVTGTTFSAGTQLLGKQLELLKEAAPAAARVAVLWNPVDSPAPQRDAAREAGRALRLTLVDAEARGPADFAPAFAAVARERADALLVSGSSTFLAHGAALAERARRARLPSVCSFREMVEQGVLMAYAINMADFIGHAAVYVDKILKGARPGDLPLEQPTVYELTVNLRTAQAIGLSLPRALLARTDAVFR